MSPDEQTALDIMAGTDADAPIVDPRTVPVRFSNLKKMSQSPVHYWHAVQHGFDETLPMRLGSGVHAMLFDQPWTVWTGGTAGKKPVRNGKKWDAFEQDNAGKCIMSIGEYRRARAITESVKRNERAAELLFDTGTIREQPISWTCLGRACASRPDVRHPGRIVELKSTKCAEPGRFARDGRWRAYHAQLAFYLDAVIQSGLGTPSAAYVVAVETLPPYPVTVFRLTERAIELGRRMCRLWLEQLLMCESADHWPGYLECDAEFDIPDDAGELIVDGESISLGSNDNDLGVGDAGLFEEVSGESDDAIF